MRRPRRSLVRLRVREDDVELIRGSEYFDADWYMAQVTDRVITEREAPRDYLARGWREGLSPSEVFDGPWYLSVNADVVDSGLEPLVHFLRFGRAEGREPMPRSKNRRGKDQPVGKYPSSGMPVYLRESRPAAVEDSPARPLHEVFGEWFDPTWYRHQSNAPFGTTAELANHYASIGWRLGYSPSRAFDPTGYLRANPDLKLLGVEPLLHFLLVGRGQGRTALPVAGESGTGSRPSTRYPRSYLRGVEGLTGGLIVVSWRRTDGDRGRAERASLDDGPPGTTQWWLEGAEPWLAKQIVALASQGSAAFMLLSENSVTISADSLRALTAGMTQARVACPVVVELDGRVVSAGVRIMPDGNVVDIGLGWSLDHDLLGAGFPADSGDPLCLLASTEVFAKPESLTALESVRAVVAGALLEDGGTRAHVVPEAVATVRRSQTHDRGHAARSRREREWFRRHLADDDALDPRMARPTDDVLPRGFSRTLVDWRVVPEAEGDLPALVARRLVDALGSRPATRVAVRCLLPDDPRTATVAALEGAGVEVWRSGAASDCGRVVTETLRVWTSDDDTGPATHARWIPLEEATQTNDEEEAHASEVLLWLPPVAKPSTPASADVALILCEDCGPRVRGAVAVALQTPSQSFETPKVVLWSRRPQRTKVLDLGIPEVRGTTRGADVSTFRTVVMWEPECPTCAIAQREATHAGARTVDLDGNAVASPPHSRDLTTVLQERPSDRLTEVKATTSGKAEE